MNPVSVHHAHAGAVSFHAAHTPRPPLIGLAGEATTKDGSHIGHQADHHQRRAQRQQARMELAEQKTGIRLLEDHQTGVVSTPPAT